MERAILDTGGNPLGVFRAAESVLVQELLAGGNVDLVEVAGTTGDAGFAEERGDFSRGEWPDLRNGKDVEVDGELLAGDGDVTSDGGGCLADGAPRALILRNGDGSAGETDEKSDQAGDLHECEGVTFGLDGQRV